MTTRPPPERSRRCGAGLQHPLLGARLENLVALLVANRGTRPGDAGLAALCLGSAVFRLPFRALDALRMGMGRDRAAADAPVFVIGHWRSGTTHLHNLLGRSPVFGHISPLACGLPDELLTLGTWLAPWLERALPEDRHVDRVAVRADSPQEDEIPLAGLQPLSVYHALYFPRRFRELAERGIFLEGCPAAAVARWRRRVRRFADKVARHQRKPLLVIKNPVYTARIGLLREIWPEARFIHIFRNPYEVFASTLNYYRRMLAELAWQDYGHLDLEEFVLATYERLMARCVHDRAALPAGQFAEVRYESLVRDPLPELERLHVELRLPGWDEARAAIEDYLPGIEGYRTNRNRCDARQAELVRSRWGEYVDRWRY